MGRYRDNPQAIRALVRAGSVHRRSLAALRLRPASGAALMTY
jgi:hypothetical protein